MTKEKKLESVVNDIELANYVKDHKLTFVPGNYGYGADGESIRRGVAIHDHKTGNSIYMGSIIIDPSNGTIEDNIPDGIIDPVKNKILQELIDTKSSYSEGLLVLYGYSN